VQVESWPWRDGFDTWSVDHHLTPSDPDVVLAKLDVGDMTVRAVRARVSDELRAVLAAGGTEVGDQIIEVRVGDSAHRQPVLAERPAMISFENSRALVFGLLPRWCGECRSGLA
jgi:hypothetical protein